MTSSTPPSEYLSTVQPAIQAALATVLKERPADPIAALSSILLAHNEPPTKKPMSVDPRGLVDTSSESVDPKTAATLTSLISNPLQFNNLTDLSLKKAGLVVVPPAIGECTLVKKLELSLNPALCTLPDEISNLSSLRILFALGCSFTHVPPALAKCPSLYMLSFKSNKLSRIDEGALPATLEWLILTDNQLTRLPENLPLGLRKFMLTNNQLECLPDRIVDCKELELIRLADNKLTCLPDGMLTMPKLSWMGLSGNPILEGGDDASELPPPIWISEEELTCHEQIGAGGGGFVHRASWASSGGENNADVALKIFRGAGTVTDGDPRHEIHLGSVLQHENVIRVLGASPEPRLGLVLELLDTKTKWAELGKPPNFDTCTRDTYPEGTAFKASAVLRTLRGVAAACHHLHSKNFTHGDLYAHNTLIESATGEAKVGDFGAAYRYSPLGKGASQLIEKIEVRAFGCMAEELLDHLATPVEEAEPLAMELIPLVAQCMQPEVSTRPSFAVIVEMLAAVGA